MSLGRFAARALVGSLFVGHGTQKLFGWFGGPGRAGTEGMMESLQMRPAKVHALAAGATETAAGALLAVGLATPAAAAGITGVMTTAIRKVHAPNGPWSSNGGWEYNAVLIAFVTAIVETGPGKISLDHLFGTERSGVRWALTALGAGVGAAFLTMSAGQRASAAAVTPAPPAPAALLDGTAGDPTTAGAGPALS